MLQLGVFPKSAHSFVVIELPSQLSNGKNHLSVMNLMGAEVYKTAITNPQTKIQTSGLGNPGLYLVFIYNTKGQIIAREKLILRSLN